MILLLFGLFSLFFSPGHALASEVIFEGYYRVDLSKKPIGYIIHRFSYEEKSKLFESTYFMRIKIGDQVTQESWQAKSNQKLKPVSYQYTLQDGNEIKTIDATFSGNVEKIKKGDGKTIKEEAYKIPSETFLASFLPLLLMQKKLKLNEAFKYSAVAEEDGNSYWGTVMPEAKETKDGLVILRMLNRFKAEEFISKVAAIPDTKETDKYKRLEVVSALTPKKNLSVELVASPSMATEEQVVPNKTLLTLFGNVPTGKVNLIATPLDAKGSH